jgi:hypothetical protein
MQPAGGIQEKPVDDGVVNTVGTFGEAEGVADAVPVTDAVAELVAVLDAEAPKESVAVGDGEGEAEGVGERLVEGVADAVNSGGHCHARIMLFPVSITKRVWKDAGAATTPRGALKAAHASGPFANAGAPRPLAHATAALDTFTVRSRWEPISATRREAPTSSKLKPHGELKRAEAPTSSHVLAAPEPASVVTAYVDSDTARTRWFEVSAT